MLLIDSLYINNSGGKILLNYLIEELQKTDIEVFYLFDLRCIGDYQEIPEERKVYMKGSLMTRYRFYKNNKNKFSKVFCFANTPPPIKLKCKVFVYFHNVSLIYQPQNYGFKERFLKKIKMYFIRVINNKNYTYIVQTNFVAQKLKKVIRNEVLILPFFKLSTPSKEGFIKKKDHFVYISNGNTHKNHEILLSAWGKLGEKSLFPTLHLTITSNYTDLIGKIECLKTQGVKIENHGYCDPIFLYEISKFSIYPSLTESFGLGIIEAINYECEIICSDLQYAYEVCSPKDVFNPFDIDSIVNAVERAMFSKINEYETKPVISNKINELLNILK